MWHLLIVVVFALLIYALSRSWRREYKEEVRKRMLGQERAQMFGDSLRNVRYQAKSLDDAQTIARSTLETKDHENSTRTKTWPRP